jgi:hypothetical protein
MVANASSCSQMGVRIKRVLKDDSPRHWQFRWSEQ